ncbi:Transmembrane protein [Senna tora]|uniref:Transmembrane protein n=1 Tax=Senna tora TaxID=362788 RepID=A0A834T8C7_9FABA|nr:Transmembrane protein [Senna tora]
MAANSKEARRRKILERGSERLALITGQIHTLPPPPPFADSLSHPFIPDNQPIPPLISHSNSSVTDEFSSYAVSPQAEAEESDPILVKHDLVSDPHHPNDSNSHSQTPSLVEHENEISRIPTTEVEQVQPPSYSPAIASDIDQVQPSPDSSIVTSGIEQRSQSQALNAKFFTAGEISSAITASKITRLCCSIFVALLVVLSYLGFPLLSSTFVKSILSFRPLYLVLVTNVTVVIAQLISGKQRGSERRAGRQNNTSPEGDHWTEHLGRALEAGLVMRNVMDAMFMDCASYAIIVICGLSLVQLFSK